jgi:hypothetical protein
MAKQKFRPTRLGGFSGAKAYIVYVEVLKKRRNAVGRTFCDAIKAKTLKTSLKVVQQPNWSTEIHTHPPDMFKQSRIVNFVRQRKIDFPGKEQIVNPVFDGQQLSQT